MSHGPAEVAADAFKRFVWRGTLEICESMERFATWSLAGVGATAALLVANVSGLQGVVSDLGIKLCLLLLALSLLAGAISKQLGAALMAGLNNLRNSEGALQSPVGQATMDAITLSGAELRDQIVAPYWWPLSSQMKKAFDRGATDPLATDKRFVQLFCFQLYWLWAHTAAAIGALLVVPFTLD